VLGLDLLTPEPRERVVASGGEEAGPAIRVVVDGAVSEEAAARIMALAAARRDARRARDFGEADRLRDELRALGAEVRDLPDGTLECRVVRG
jgi:cysteinyl-tRNA synthetase